MFKNVYKSLKLAFFFGITYNKSNKKYLRGAMKNKSIIMVFLLSFYGVDSFAEETSAPQELGTKIANGLRTTGRAAAKWGRKITGTYGKSAEDSAEIDKNVYQGAKKKSLMAKADLEATILKSVEAISKKMEVYQAAHKATKEAEKRTNVENNKQNWDQQVLSTLKSSIWLKIMLNTYGRITAGGPMQLRQILEMDGSETEKQTLGDLFKTAQEKLAGISEKINRLT